MQKEKYNYKKLVKKILLSLVVLIVFLVLLYWLFKGLGITNLNEEELQAYLASFGSLAPILFILLVFLQVTFIPIPSTVVVVVGDYLFGFWLSFLYSFIGMMIGSMVAFYLGRWLGKKFIYWIVSDKEVVDNYILKLQGKENVLLFFMFLFPFFPDDLLCMVAGVLPISGISFFIMQFFTRSTTILATLFVLSGDVIPFNKYGIPIIVMIIIIFGIIFYMCYKNSDKINKWFSNIIDKIFHKMKK